MLPRNFPIDREVRVANLLPTCWQQTSRSNGIWETTRDTTDTTDFCPQSCATNLLSHVHTGKSPISVVYVADLLAAQRGSRQFVTDLLKGN